MINSLLETENCCKYQALYLAQQYISDKKYIQGSEIALLIKHDVKEQLETNQEWKDNYQILYKELSNKSRENNGMNKLDEIISKYKSNQKINNWSDIIDLYCLVAIVSQICALTDCKTEYVVKTMDMCSEKHIVNWIIKHGGWNAYYDAHKHNTNYITYLAGFGILVSTVSIVTYFFKKK
jgi:hypothetical protein